MSKVLDISKGIYKFIARDDKTERIAKSRYDICKSCELRRGFKCSECGCILAFKTRCVSYTNQCPAGLWISPSISCMSVKELIRVKNYNKSIIKKRFGSDVNIAMWRVEGEHMSLSDRYSILYSRISRASVENEWDEFEKNLDDYICACHRLLNL